MKKVVLIGLGAVGLTYSVKLKDKCKLYILADKARIDKYFAHPPMFNGVEQNFDYITPDAGFDADLIIITTKFQGLDSAILSIKNFVGENTRIISLINGISSEEKIRRAYPQAKVLKSYFIGHSAVRNGNNVTQDGVGEIVIEKDDFIREFFSFMEIDFSMPKDIDYSMWLKYTFNSFANPLSAILNMNFGELKSNRTFKNFAKNIIAEIRMIAEKKGINNLENLEKDSFKSLDRMCDDGKTSMLQDVLAKRPTEIDIFSGEIIKMGNQYGIRTPYNRIIYDLIKIKEENYECSIHTG